MRRYQSDMEISDYYFESKEIKSKKKKIKEKEQFSFFKTIGTLRTIVKL